MTRHKKTGGGGGRWVVFDSIRPPAVKDHYSNHTEASGELSERCKWWLHQIDRGWRPNRRMLNCCWDCNSERLGVYAWEYMGPICVALKNGRFGDYNRANAERKAQIPLGPDTYETWMMKEIKSLMRKELDDEIDRQVLHGEGGN